MRTIKFNKKLQKLREMLYDYKIETEGLTNTYKIGLYEVHVYSDLIWFKIIGDNHTNEVQDCSQWGDGVIGSRYCCNHNKNGGHNTFQMDPKLLLSGLINYIQNYKKDELSE